MKWFRFYNDAVADNKLKLLAFEDRWHYVAVLCMKSSGLLDQKKNELRERRIAADLGLSLREAEEVKRRLMEVELIKADWQPKSWDKRQYKHDDNAERQRAYRERKKQEKQQDTESGSNVTECNALRNANVTVTGTDTDTDTDTDTEKHNPDFDLVDPVLWSDFLKHRKAMKAVNSERALNTIKNKLIELAGKGYDPNGLVETAIERSWKTIFEPHEKPKQKSSVGRVI